MKKSIIVTGAASLAVAAMPVVGVFADTTTVTDTVRVTINKACSLTATRQDEVFSQTMTNSQLKSNIGSTTIAISCNDAGGWKLTAQGYSSDTAGTNTMVPTGSSTAIATGTATSGGTSNWAMKVEGTGAVNFTDFAAVPGSSSAIVATQNTTTATASLTTTYQVWISATQEADTYTGKVLYTLVNPAT